MKSKCTLAACVLNESCITFDFTQAQQCNYLRSIDVPIFIAILGTIVE